MSGDPETRAPSGMRLLVRRGGEVYALEGISVESIEPRATVSEVPGSQLAMTLVRGQVVPVLRLGDLPGPLVVGCVRREVIALFGVEVIGLQSETDKVPLVLDIEQCLDSLTT